MSYANPYETGGQGRQYRRYTLTLQIYDYTVHVVYVSVSDYQPLKKQHGGGSRLLSYRHDTETKIGFNNDRQNFFSFNIPNGS